MMTEQEYVYSVSEQFKSFLDSFAKEHSGLKIYYFYPSKFNDSKPVISYKLASNTITAQTIDLKPRKQESDYYVDFWGKSPAELDRLCSDLKAHLQKEGYTCTFEQDLKDMNEIYYHKSTRFQVKFDNKLKIVL